MVFVLDQRGSTLDPFVGGTVGKHDKEENRPLCTGGNSQCNLDLLVGFSYNIWNIPGQKGPGYDVTI